MHSLFFTDTLFFQKFFSIQFLSFFSTKSIQYFSPDLLKFFSFSKFSMYLIFLIKLFFDNFLPLIFSAKSSNQNFYLNYSFYHKSFLIISFFPIRNVYLLIIYACSKNVYFQKKFSRKFFTKNFYPQLFFVLLFFLTICFFKVYFKKFPYTIFFILPLENFSIQIFNL